MKTINAFIMALALLVAVPSAFAQKSDKELKKDLKSKVYKESRKEAKVYKKEGWKVMPGKLSLERQIQDSKYADLDQNSDGSKRYFTASHQSVGGNYTAAKQIADNRARLELAQSISSAVKALVKDNIANSDLGESDIRIIDEFVSANESLVSARLQGVIPVLEMYRERDKGQCEVRVLLKMDSEKAIKIAKESYQAELRKKSEDLADKLDKIIP